MNAPFFASKAVLRDSEDRNKGGFPDPILAVSRKIEADLASGAQVLTMHGIMSPDDLAQRVEIDGGWYYPTRSCGRGL